jgi:hypothetical protein
MIDYLETSENLRKPAVEVFGRFPAGFWQVSVRFPAVFRQVSGRFPNFSSAYLFFKIRKPARNLRGRLPEVSRGFRIIHN